MRVRCDIAEVDVEGDYTLVEGVCATCTRCGHEVESCGTSDASIRRCLAVMREECPRSERNYYVQAPAASSPIAAAYQRGYRAGQQAARQDAPLTAEQLRALVTLTHPDRHPPERFELANKATARLLELLREGDRAS